MFYVTPSNKYPFFSLPQDYPTLDFSTPPLPMLPAQHLQNTGGGTLRRGMSNHRGLVPPPDVTHVTHNNIHDTSMSMTGGNSTLSNNISQVSQSTPKQPQGILKDPNRSKQQQPNNVQILNVQNAPPGTLLGNNLLMTTGYDPNNTNLGSFNASLGYTDADGHLV